MPKLKIPARIASIPASNIPLLAASAAAIYILISLWFPAPEASVPEGWQVEQGCRYYQCADGSRPSGWLTLEEQQYYFLNDGIPATGWQELEGKRYYFLSDGTPGTGWCRLEGQRFYLNSDGSAATGPTEINGHTYLFEESGALASGIFLYQGHYYQAGASGHPLSGRAASGNIHYRFDENGKAITGWQTIDGLAYYFYDDGSPASGITVLDGVTWHFSSSGLYVPLVNPWNQIPADYTAELTQINGTHSVASIAYEDYLEMMAALQADGLRAAVCSSFRTQEYQQMLFDRKVYYYIAIGHDREEATVLAGQSVAIPGTSEHQLGLALDIVDTSNWNLNETQAETPAQQWLIEHSWEYGWILRYPDGKSDITGIIYEPWHYRYVGRETAAEIHELGLCLEEYLEMLTVG